MTRDAGQVSCAAAIRSRLAGQFLVAADDEDLLPEVERTASIVVDLPYLLP
ncbi:hypothetical protein X759_27290 [Mesorhizobium sp. LSHC420B00]|nr:hypothetical protein X759_27290 [Mesorhizobium sp. LSHC420B00]